MIGAVVDIDRERARHELRLRLIELCEIGLRIGNTKLVGLASAGLAALKGNGGEETEEPSSI
jgi:hypothetical protein